jgi:excisionase family DNA binding protein
VSDAQQQEPPIVVDVPEAARLMGISETSAWRLIADGTLPSMIVGRRRRMVRRDAIETYLLVQEGKVSRGE